MGRENGTYLHLQRLSTEDGPGIRTTVFLKGCVLRCQWCHNPESLLPKPQVQRVETNCIQCGTCLLVCPQGCLQSGDGFVELNRLHCNACGICVKECPAGAWEMLGVQASVDKLYAEIIKDRSYYQKSGGGVTLSGGEPALQADFCAALMMRLQAAGIHTALDTCGMVSRKNLEKILPHTDLILYDVKEIDPLRHVAFTGQSNAIVFENLKFVGETIRDVVPQKCLWVRTPLIPGATATQENLAGIGAYLVEHLEDVVERWELCSFNNLCRDKYRRLGMNWEYSATPLLTCEELSQMEYWAKQSVFPAERIIATGATQLLPIADD